MLYCCFSNYISNLFKYNFLNFVLVKNFDKWLESEEKQTMLLITELWVERETVPKKRLHLKNSIRVSFSRRDLLRFIFLLRSTEIY